MTDDTDTDEGGRSTAPQSEYTAREIAVGAAVAAVGVAITVGVPLVAL